MRACERVCIINTQQEIADVVGSGSTDKILRVSGNLEDLPKNQKAAAEHATGFKAPIYNVWKKQNKSHSLKLISGKQKAGF